VGTLAPSGAALAQDGGFQLFGSIGAGGLGMHEETKDAAKLYEYRDLSDGPFGVFTLRGRGSRFHFDAYGENLGRDDMYLNLQGGNLRPAQVSGICDWLADAQTPVSVPMWGAHALHQSRVRKIFGFLPLPLRPPSANTSVPPWTILQFRRGSAEYRRKCRIFGRLIMVCLL
jgi:hypothetical protein